MSNPIISVVMPVYNGGKYLKEAIDSILNQTLTNFEFIIINDGSTDNTEEIILSYDDERIFYVKNKTNLQIVKTLNKGIDLAKGKYIARMDADDISLPKRFEKQFRFMEEYPDIDVCGSYVKTIGSRQLIWRYPVSSQFIKVACLFFSPIAHPSVFGRTVFFQSNRYNFDYQKAEDFKLWTSNIYKTNFSNIPEVLVNYRLHDSQTGEKYSDVQLQISNVIRKEMLGYLGVTYTDEELDTHIKISRYKYVDMYIAEEWLCKLKDTNKRSNAFDEESFEIFINDKWWWVVNNSTHRGLEIFLYYCRSNTIRLHRKKWLHFIKFFMKCLIRYSS
jgi:glycosyltransferase involved in cell wall biosynthesis